MNSQKKVVKINSRSEYKSYTGIQEAVEMLESKGLSAVTLNEFGMCYIPVNSFCKTDLLWERLALPIHDFHGNIIAYAGRKMISRIELVETVFRNKYPSHDLVKAKISKWEKSKWINEPYEKSKNIFNIHRAYRSIIESNYVIVVEGYFDVMGLYNKGVTNVIATCGTSLSRYQALFLKALCDHCIIMFDPDEAGILASENAKETLASIGITSTIVTLPNNIDPDDYIVNKKSSSLKSVFNSVINNKIDRINLN